MPPRVIVNRLPLCVMFYQFIIHGFRVKDRLLIQPLIFLFPCLLMALELAMARVQVEFDADEKIKETPASLLYDFLYKCGHHALHPSISIMFNCDLSLEETLSCHPRYFEEARQEFDDLTHEDTVMIDGKNYIHFNLKVSPEKKQRLNRDWHKVPSDKKRAGACP